MEKFSEILKDLIDEKSLSLRTIEKETGIPSSQLSRYLKSTIPNLSTAVRLSEYFNCSLDYLFGLSDTKMQRKYKNIDLSKFVERYTNALKQNNTTHWKFAKTHNISEACLRHWKYGEEPRLSTLCIIAEYLSVSIDYLVGRC